MKGVFALAGACGLCIVLAGCSKEPEEASESAGAAPTAGSVSMKADVSTLGIDSATAAKATDCAVKHLAQHESLGPSQEPRDAFDLQQDTEHFVYWGKQNAFPVVFCTGSNPPGPVDILIRENPFYVVNAAVIQRAANAATYTPSAKGEFEKTADYDARIAAEKAAHDAKFGGSKFSAKNLEIAFAGLLGAPKLKQQMLSSDPDPLSYNADTETLSLIIVPQMQRRVMEGNLAREIPVFEIPVAVKVPADIAQKFLEIVRSEGYAYVNPSLAMELRDGRLVVREYSLKGAPDGRLQRALDAAGIRLENIPTEYEIPFHFGG